MSIVITEEKSLYIASQVFPFISSLDQYYPDISNWYVNTVIPGLLIGNDKLLVAKENSFIVGIGLGKLTKEETKLRCIRVHPDYQGTGLGIKIIDKMLDQLESDHPAVTVSEEMIHNFSRIFINRYGFKLNHVTKGQYRPFKLEYLFN